MTRSAGFSVWPRNHQCHQVAHERLVQALEMLHDREAVHHDQPRDGVRMIHRSAEGDQRAAVVTHHREPLMAEVPHERDHVVGHRPLGGLSVLGRIRQVASTARSRADQGRRRRTNRRAAALRGARSCGCAGGRGAAPPAPLRRRGAHAVSPLRRQRTRARSLRTRGTPTQGSAVEATRRRRRERVRRASDLALRRSARLVEDEAVQNVVGRDRESLLDARLLGVREA